MKYLLRLRTAEFAQSQLPNLPKPARVVSFAGGVVVGTVAAVTVFGGSPRPNALALVDSSDSMKTLKEPIRQHLTRLRKTGVNPVITRVTGFGMRADGNPAGVLGALNNALQLDPAIDSVYLFSDFNCQSPAYDTSDEKGRAEFEKIVRDRHIRLFIPQLDQTSVPDQNLVALAKNGGWQTLDGKLVSGPGAAMRDVTLRGTVHSEVDGTLIPGAIVTVGDSYTTYFSTESDSKGAYRLKLIGLCNNADRLSLTASLSGVPGQPVTVRTDELSGKEIALRVPGQAKGIFAATTDPAKPVAKKEYYVVVTLNPPQPDIQITVSIAGNDSQIVKGVEDYHKQGTELTDADGRVRFGPIPGGADGVTETVTVDAPTLNKKKEPFQFVF